MARTATIERKTAETDIRATFCLDGSGKSEIQTGIGFMDHMLTLFSRHGFFDLQLQAKGDLDVDAHHTMEDLGIVLGSAIRNAVGDKRGIRRYGFFLLPMDEALVRVVLDLSGRPYLQYNLLPPAEYIGSLHVRLFQEFFQALSWNAGMNLHLDSLHGEEVHHVYEAAFKGFARALDLATQADPRESGIPSTKGILA